MNDKKRFTCRILTVNNIEKTVTFRANDIEDAERILKGSFHAVKYKLYRINGIRFSAGIPWEVIA